MGIGGFAGFLGRSSSSVNEAGLWPKRSCSQFLGAWEGSIFRQAFNRYEEFSSAAFVRNEPSGSVVVVGPIPEPIVGDIRDILEHAGAHRVVEQLAPLVHSTGIGSRRVPYLHDHLYPYARHHARAISQEVALALILGWHGSKWETNNRLGVRLANEAAGGRLVRGVLWRGRLRRLGRSSLIRRGGSQSRHDAIDICRLGEVP